MNTKRVVYTEPDGRFAVFVPAPSVPRRLVEDPEAVGGWRLESDSERLFRLAAKALPAGAVAPVECDVSEIPADRTFRDAWCAPAAGDPDRVEETPRVAVRMSTAREIHMHRIRRARDAELQRLDIEQMKGEDVAAAKQRLRDLPATVDLEACATPAEVKAVWPEELAGQPMIDAAPRRAR